MRALWPCFLMAPDAQDPVAPAVTAGWFQVDIVRRAGRVTETQFRPAEGSDFTRRRQPDSGFKSLSDLDSEHLGFADIRPHPEGESAARPELRGGYP